MSDQLTWSDTYVSDRSRPVQIAGDFVVLADFPGVLMLVRVRPVPPRSRLQPENSWTFPPSRKQLLWQRRIIVFGTDFQGLFEQLQSRMPLFLAIADEAQLIVVRCLLRIEFRRPAKLRDCLRQLILQL